MKAVLHIRLLVVAILFVLVPACGSGGKPDPYLGNMDDFSYGARRDRTYGESASGETVQLEDLAGQFVWVDFAATWCPPCLRQAPIIRKLEHAYDGKVVFLTVLTSDGKPGKKANRSTARLWAKRFKLDPDRVIAGDEWARIIPTHIVFSPLGQTLYFKTGLHSEAQIRSTIGSVIREWEPWYAENKTSMSVLLSEIGD